MSTSTGWTIAGTDIRTDAFEIETVTGWDSHPGLRGTNLEIAGRDGKRFTGRKYYKSRSFALAIRALPQNSSGAVTHTEGAHAHIRENIDDLLAMLDGADSLISVQRTEPNYPGAGTTVREILAEVIATVPIINGQGRYDRTGLVVFEAPHPFWRELPVNTQLAFTTGNITTGGNIRIGDMVIDFNGFNGVQRLTHDSSGDYIEIDGDTTVNPVTVDVGNRTVMQNGSPAEDLITFTKEYWMRWPSASTVGLTLTGTGDVDLTWYDQWK